MIYTPTEKLAMLDKALGIDRTKHQSTQAQKNTGLNIYESFMQRFGKERITSVSQGARVFYRIPDKLFDDVKAGKIKEKFAEKTIETILEKLCKGSNAQYAQFDLEKDIRRFGEYTYAFVDYEYGKVCSIPLQIDVNLDNCVTLEVNGISVCVQEPRSSDQNATMISVYPDKCAAHIVPKLTVDFNELKEVLNRLGISSIK